MVSGWQQALTLIVVLIPGFVYQGVKRHRVGPSPEEREISIRLLRALVTSVIFLVIYGTTVGDLLADRFVNSNPDNRFNDVWLLGLTIGALVFAIQALTGHVAGAHLIRKRYFNRPDSRGFWNTLRTPANTADGELTWSRALFRSDTDYSPVPTAWDFATQSIPLGSFIRVLLPDDTWLGGQANSGTYFTGYPEPRDLYLDHAWQLSDEGEFEHELPGPTGIWIPCADAKLLQVTPSGGDTPDNDNDNDQQRSPNPWITTATCIVAAILVHRTLRPRILERTRRQR